MSKLRPGVLQPIRHTNMVPGLSALRYWAFEKAVDLLPGEDPALIERWELGLQIQLAVFQDFDRPFPIFPAIDLQFYVVRPNG